MASDLFGNSARNLLASASYKHPHTIHFQAADSNTEAMADILMLECALLENSGKPPEIDEQKIPLACASNNSKKYDVTADQVLQLIKNLIMII